LIDAVALGVAGVRAQRRRARCARMLDARQRPQLERHPATLFEVDRE
jgi:hypothetical protein